MQQKIVLIIRISKFYYYNYVINIKVYLSYGLHTSYSIMFLKYEAHTKKLKFGRTYIMDFTYIR